VLFHSRAMIWTRLLTYITASVDQELLLRNEYLATENRILKNQIEGRLRLTDLNGSVWPRLASALAEKGWMRWRRLFGPTGPKGFQAVGADSGLLIDGSFSTAVRSVANSW